jgi:hypothetical protein
MHVQRTRTTTEVDNNLIKLINLFYLDTVGISHYHT